MGAVTARTQLAVETNQLGDPSPATTKHQPTWGLGDAALGWVLSIVGAVVAGSLVLTISGKQEFDELSLGWVALGEVGLWLGFITVPWIAARTKGNGMVEDFGLRAKWVDPAIGLAAGIGAQIASVILYVPLLNVLGKSGDELSEPARNLTDRATDSFGVVMLVLIVGIGAPIFEEIFYRGLVLRAFEHRYGSSWAIVGSAVLFGASHLQPLQFPGLTLLGLILGYITVRVGRLGPAISAHLVFNMMTVIALLSD